MCMYVHFKRARKKRYTNVLTVIISGSGEITDVFLIQYFLIFLK